MSNDGAAPRAAAPVSSARAEASRRNGAKSRGPTTPEGKARSAQNALRHGLRAEKHMVLPDEDGAEFAALEAAMVEELAPVGALQIVLARRVAVAAWRLARADRIEADLFAERSYGAAGPGLALIRDGNGTRSFETLLRYRGAAMGEFWRALRTLKALQAEQAATELDAAAPGLAAHSLEPRPTAPAAPRALARRPRPDEPERAAESRLEYVMPDPRAQARTLHEPVAPWRPNEPQRAAGRQLDHTASELPAGTLHEPAAPWLPNKPETGSGIRLRKPPSLTEPSTAEPAHALSAPPASSPRISRRS
jgi:hypothetical protein